MSKGVCALDELITETAKLKEDGKTIIFTNGCFDILHAGHVDYLNRAKQYGDYLIVGLNTDASVTRLKGTGRPVANEQDRGVVLASLRAVDAVCFFDDDTPIKLIKALHPDVLVKGADYRVDEIVGHEEVLAEGGKVVPIPLVPGKSTTDLIRKIRSLPE